LRQLFSDGTQPKWAKDLILSELKPLFLRTRHLDNSKKNLIIRDFLSVLFPSFAEQHHERLAILAADFCKSWSNWRNVLWQKITQRYEKFSKNSKSSSVKDRECVNSYLKSIHISEIFETWTKHVSSRLSNNEEMILKNLVMFAFHFLIKNPKTAHDEFFSFTGNLYTINCNFPSTYNIATSMDLSKYEITLEIKSPDNSDEEKPKKRSKKK